MILIGTYRSPVIRRIGATLVHYGIEFEHRDPDKGRGHEHDTHAPDPIRREPGLFTDNSTLWSSPALIFYELDNRAPRERTLVPADRGNARVRFVETLNICTRINGWAVALTCERSSVARRGYTPPEGVTAHQMREDLTRLEATARTPWMWGEAMTHIDLATACAWEHIAACEPELFATLQCPTVASVTARASELEALRRTRPQWRTERK